MNIFIPGRKELDIRNLLLDYNGTIALDGKLINGLEEKLMKIRDFGVKIYVLTADTHGTVKKQCEQLPVEIKIFNSDKVRFEKERIVEELNGKFSAAIGNGFNDGLMFKKSALSIIVMGEEGCSMESMLVADIACRSIEDALNLFIDKKRMIATLRG